MRFEVGFTKKVPYEPVSSHDIQAQLDLLGPFEPPRDYALEPELCPPIPRPISEEVRRGYHAYRQRTMVVELSVLAVACLVASRLEFVCYLGGFFLPLLYLDWIGLSIALLVTGVWTYRQFTPGPLQYIELGAPLVGRICSETLRPLLVDAFSHNVLNYQFAALVQYIDPRTHEMVACEMTSIDIKLDDKDLIASSYRVGDYVTLVYLERDPKSTMRLYGYLGLRSDYGVTVSQSRHGWEYYAMFVGALAVFGFFAWTLYAWQRYWPIEPSWELIPPAIAGAIVAAGLVFGALAFERRWLQKTRSSRNEAALISGAAAEKEVEIHSRREHQIKATWAGAIALAAGCLAGLACAVYANAQLDHSTAQLEPVLIGDLIVNIEKVVFRSGTIKYGFTERADGSYHSFFTSPEELSQFRRGAPGTAYVRAGRFGWPWIEKLEPKFGGVGAD